MSKDASVESRVPERHHHSNAGQWLAIGFPAISTNRENRPVHQRCAWALCRKTQPKEWAKILQKCSRTISETALYQPSGHSTKKRLTRTPLIKSFAVTARWVFYDTG